jgi:hypothetical protein
MSTFQAALHLALHKHAAAGTPMPTATPAPTIPAAPAPAPAAPAANPTPAAATKSPFDSKVDAIKAKAGRQKSLYQTQREVMGVGAEKMKNQKMQQDLEQSAEELARSGREAEQKRMEDAQAMQAQQEQQQMQEMAAAAQPANLMQQAAMQQKVAGAAPYYFGIPNLYSLKMFQSPLRVGGSRR